MPTTLACRVAVLVKALPQPSKNYGETVCCAGVTATREWKRLFPVRFRHLTGESSFSRWDWVQLRYREPTSDRRRESCHVYEDSITVDGQLARRDRERLLEPMMVGSASAAMSAGHSLAAIRPRNTRFTHKKRSADDIEEAREAYRRAARQTSLLDKELEELDPSPYEFRFKFDDDGGSHDYENGDWETHVTFWRWRAQYGEQEALRLMDGIFNDEYPRKGMIFAIGNQAKRPHVWQLLGVIRLDDTGQPELAL